MRVSELLRSTTFVVTLAGVSVLAPAAVPQTKGPHGRHVKLRQSDMRLPEPIRLRVEPPRVRAGETVKVVGGDFGAQPQGRRLVVQLGERLGPTMTIERWTNNAIDARLPKTLPADASKVVIALVDPAGRLLGRDGLEIVPAAAHESRRRGMHPHEAGSGRGERDQESGRDVRREKGDRDARADKSERDAGLDGRDGVKRLDDAGREKGREEKLDQQREGKSSDSRADKGAKGGEPDRHARADKSERDAGPDRREGDKRQYDAGREKGREEKLDHQREGKSPDRRADKGAKDRARQGIERRGFDPGPGDGREDDRHAQLDRDGRQGPDLTGSDGGLPDEGLGRGAHIERNDQGARRFPSRPALVLGGGGSRGAFQVGVLKNLYTRGLSPSIITGTSVGALNAAKLAEGDERIDALVQLWRGIVDNDSIYVQSPHLTRLIGDATHDACGLLSSGAEGSAKNWFGQLKRWPDFGDAATLDGPTDLAEKVNEVLMDVNAMEGFHLQRGLARTVAANLSTEAVATSGIKLRITATDRASGDLRYFTENGDIELPNGSIWQRGRTDGADLHEDVLKPPTVADAVMASSAIPMFFSPWFTKGGEAYWDGAVREGLPVHKALELGATDIVAILTGPRETLSTAPPKKYTLIIERVRRLGKNSPDHSSAEEYYARVKWGHEGWKKTDYFQNDRDVSPHWRFAGVEGEIRVEIKDYDYPDKDDVLDAGPAAGHNELLIDLDPRRVTDAQHPARFPIQGDGQGQIGDLITVVGAGDDDPVEVSFRIRPESSGSSGYTKGLPADLAPLTQAMQLMTHQGSEVSATDLADLDQLDVLHELAGELSEGSVVRAVKSFPLPRDLRGQAYGIPDYVLIEPPFVFGDLQEFEAEAIDFNIELGDTVARWTRVGFLDRLPTSYDADGTTPIPTQRAGISDERLEQQKRAAVMGLIRSRIDTWTSRERAGSDLARCWRERYEALQEKANHTPIRPARRNPASAR